MKRFIQRFSDKVMGVLNGFDRLVLRGTLRPIAYSRGMMGFLWHRQIRLSEFGKYVYGVCQKVRYASLKEAEESGRPIVYLRSSNTDKAKVAEEIALKDGIKEGLITVISCLEPCIGYDVAGNRETKHLELVQRQRKCLFLYHYWMHPEFGFMNARIQSWFPFNIQICLNGREWLARQMHRTGIRYRQTENCFTWIENTKRAQNLMDRQLETNWKRVLDQIAQKLNPIHQEIFSNFPIQYYWSTFQSEWATDVMFHKQQDLLTIYRPFVLHGITHFSSGDIMRFLGKKVNGHFQGEILSDFKNRPEGIRIKHYAGKNSVKLYDKQGTVLRAETTINDPKDFKIFRTKEKEPKGERKWRPLRRGVADLHRRAQISQASNERYLEALAAADTSIPLGKLLEKICQPTHWKGKSVRPLHPGSAEDLNLVRAINHGEFVLNGFSNSDVRKILFPNVTDNDKKHISSKVTRLFRMLRAHHLIRKISSRNRYMITAKGREITTAILTAYRITLAQLNEAVA
jgi:hypothetical protein